MERPAEGVLLETGRLVLRQFTMSDAGNLAAGRGRDHGREPGFPPRNIAACRARDLIRLENKPTWPQLQAMEPDRSRIELFDMIWWM